ncbi:hypothetical protein H696_02460 [Fonticula alba]|uniref:Uncharacterized protein n=1 Tax=Fonticula alba TaxID=691883 RepID=A0A058ZC46_FONAL|nr:hypothetical protein H696_02460 [Fonticula alba]KCV71516.1 hypothetical protein H696_02460 [Fonticula alba]|eukprot:XP_009494639.1 hypothetical protein H696_02460 [Fonticula alba]
MEGSDELRSSGGPPAPSPAPWLPAASSAPSSSAGRGGMAVWRGERWIGILSSKKVVELPVGREPSRDGGGNGGTSSLSIKSRSGQGAEAEGGRGGTGATAANGGGDRGAATAPESESGGIGGGEGACTIKAGSGGSVDAGRQARSAPRDDHAGGTVRRSGGEFKVPVAIRGAEWQSGAGVGTGDSSIAGVLHGERKGVVAVEEGKAQRPSVVSVVSAAGNREERREPAEEGELRAGSGRGRRHGAASCAERAITTESRCSNSEGQEGLVGWREGRGLSRKERDRVVRERRRRWRARRSKGD